MGTVASLGRGVERCRGTDVRFGHDDALTRERRASRFTSPRAVLLRGTAIEAGTVGEVRNGVSANLRIDVNDFSVPAVLNSADINAPAFFRGNYALDFSAPAGCHQFEFRVRSRSLADTFIALISTHVDAR